MFICMMYSVSDVNKCDDARVKLFCKCKSQDALPPTSDAIKFHIMRAHYQSLVWMQATKPHAILPSPATMGWREEDGQLVPQLISLAPIPESCADIVTCGCTKGCKSQSCTCRKGKLTCTGACKCAGSDISCMNRQDTSF